MDSYDDSDWKKKIKEIEESYRKPRIETCINDLRAVFLEVDRFRNIANYFEKLKLEPDDKLKEVISQKE